MHLKARGREFHETVDAKEKDDLKMSIDGRGMMNLTSPSKYLAPCLKKKPDKYEGDTFEMIL